MLPVDGCPTNDSLSSKVLTSVEVAPEFELEVSNSNITTLVASGTLILNNVESSEVIAPPGGTVVIQGNVGGGGPMTTVSGALIVEQADSESVNISKEVILQAGGEAHFHGQGNLQIQGKLEGNQGSHIAFQHSGERHVAISSGITNGENLVFGNNN